MNTGSLMKKVIISTLYGAEPVVLSVTKYGADKLILIANKDPDKVQDEAMEAVKNAFEKVLEIKPVKVDPYDVVKIAAETVKAIDFMGDDDKIIVNISSGRKTMSLGLLFAAYKRAAKIDKILYVSEEKQIIQLPKLSFSLTQSQQKVMELIEGGKYKTLMEMSEKIDISRGMLYRNIKELQDLGLIDVSDGLKLTDAGKISVL